MDKKFRKFIKISHGQFSKKTALKLDTTTLTENLTILILFFLIFFLFFLFFLFDKEKIEIKYLAQKFFVFYTNFYQM